MDSRKTIAILLLLAAWGLVSDLAQAGESWKYGNPLTTVSLGRTQVLAEVVSTPEKTYLGLGQRPGLPEGRGMLFAMPCRQVQVFCMRDMQFALDFIWLRDGKVMGLAKNISPEFQGEIVSPAPVDHVLEVPAGFCDRHGIKVGDKASW